ncbi:hypothetical protein [Rhodanobacter sp. DHG33]|uniref:hypothetical protein n=1 Tax=Rhodanobacter sp. DHG33 TaxID=2775921 RepID=UPI001782B211|nr:hypothetical protein [Rhodanobacter sp. DHG33]MBD8898985.1 hypothetical protein [Rhodanobacter sp. DHG33]
MAVYYRFFDSGRGLARWLPLDDLWSIYLFEFLIASVATWVIGYPFYRSARARRTVSGTGLCVVGGIASGLVWLLSLLILAVGSHLYAPFLLSLIGAFKGVVIAGVFSVLAGVPWSSGRSMLLQNE